jgi:prephenate dehydrogenase
MKSREHVAIIGLGLIGGSLARDLAAAGAVVSAFDNDAAQLDAAIAAGVVTHALDAWLAGVAGASTIVIAVPVDAATDVLRRIAPHAGRATLITDVGSTKSRIVDEAVTLGLADRFVGSHPMAGDHRSGWEASRRALFTGARVYLCATQGASPALVERAELLWRGVNARPCLVDAEHHDRKLAWSSHLPHVVSTTLALALARAGITREELGPGGRDVTRLAGSSPDMWTAIARENATAIDAALAAVEHEIAGFRDALARADATALHQKFTAGRGWFVSAEAV